MITILKGLLALPLVALIVGALGLMGAILVGAIGILFAAACIIIPYLLRLIVVAAVLLFPLWLLGALVNGVTRRSAGQ